MASDKRPIIKLRSTAGTGYTYVTTKNKTNTRHRIELKKYDPVIRKPGAFKEAPARTVGPPGAQRRL
ncbi:MAG: 50S ribosomal protein L33 [Acidimicrobiaceae bacterium]|nr:50S ribosomal protein L33 [Acidimicrobiaceae bacterium]